MQHRRQRMRSPRPSTSRSPQNRCERADGYEAFLQVRSCTSPVREHYSPEASAEFAGPMHSLDDALRRWPYCSYGCRLPNYTRGALALVVAPLPKWRGRWALLHAVIAT
jgi:hypothetical protein